ncbi:MAG: PAS domain-containing protein, partial [Clostridia bacterium]|nr:PAS domain-containing protein [Clostridia bacterium]
KYPYRINIVFDTPKEIRHNESSTILFFSGRHTATKEMVGDFKVRGTIGCVRTEQGWLINTVHASVPNYVVEKKTLEQELEETRKKEHILLSYIPGGVAIYRMKKDGRFVTDYVSDGLGKMCGYENGARLHESIHKDAMVMVAEEDAAIVMAAARRSIETGQGISIRYHLHVKDKPDVLNRLDANLMDGDLAEDDIAVWYAVHTIVSEESQQIIREQKQLQALMDDVPAGIGIYEVINGEITQNYMNDAFYQMLGTTRENRRRYFGNNTLKAAHPDDFLPIRTALKKLMSGENRAEATYRILVENDRWFWIHLTGSIVERRENYMKIYATLSDYNETMQAQNELEYGRITLKTALTAAKVLTWRYDYKTSRITDSLTLGEAFHLPKVVDNVPQSIIDMGFISDESVDGFRGLFEEVKTEKTVHADVKANVKNELGYAWYRLMYTPVFDVLGNYLDSIAIAIDITEQKERELRYEEQLRLNQIAAQGALAYASYNLTIYTVTEYESDNPKLCEVMKHGVADEVLRGIQNIVCDVKDQEKFALLATSKSMIKAYQSGISHIEVRHRLKENSGWMQTTFDMIANPRTGDIEAIGFLRDITEIVRSELVVNQLLSVDYQSIIMTELKTGLVIPFQHDKNDGILTEIVKMQREHGDITKGLNAFFGKYAVPGTVSKVIEENSPGYISRKLDMAPFYECVYSLMWKGKKHDYRIIYAYLEPGREVLLCAIQDVTEMYEQEEKQKEKLSLALEEAKAANKAKTAFLSRVSHDMRTPLNGILGLTTLLKESTTDDKISRDLTELEMSGKYLLNLINDTLDMSRIESG